MFLYCILFQVTWTKSLALIHSLSCSTRADLALARMASDFTSKSFAPCPKALRLAFVRRFLVARARTAELTQDGQGQCPVQLRRHSL